jgi:hypothetical protein
MYLGELETCGQKRVSLKLAYAGTAAAPASSGHRRRASMHAHQATSPAIDTLPLSIDIVLYIALYRIKCAYVVFLCCRVAFSTNPHT